MTPDAVFVLVSMLSLGLALLLGVRRGIRALHMLQLDGYSNARFARWLRLSPRTRLLSVEAAAILLALLLASGIVLFLGWPVVWSTGLLCAWLVAGGVLLTKKRVTEVKKPLTYTGRAWRILVVASVLLGALVTWAGIITIPMAMAGRSGYTSLLILLFCLLVTQSAPVMVIAANVVLAPIQWGINGHFLKRARVKLRMVSPIVVGITGSYAKTSTKHFLSTILAKKRSPCMTPHSYNTLMGVCRAINENLRSDHDIFVVEMGAYRRGDIRELCKLGRPAIGVLTAIGPQHLERFKTIESIEATKYELIESLPDEGLAVFNADDPRCSALADRTKRRRVVRYSVSRQPGSQVWVENLAVSRDCMRFEIVTSDGRREWATTQLIGRHNVSNILAATCVALELGLDLSLIAAGIGELEPPARRLQVIHQGGIVIIDDSYNSNPKGAAEALEALSMFATGRRILVTSAMVELGAVEDGENERFGAHAAAICDYVILVGREQTASIRRGLRKKGFPNECVAIVSGLGEAKEWLSNTLKAGDVVLFKNDLPDLYLDRQKI